MRILVLGGDGYLGWPTCMSLSNEGYEVYLAELTGGPESELVEYTYDDLVNYYLPSLVSGVLEYSGSKKIDYFGNSNGCRVGLQMLNTFSDGKANSGYVFNYETGGWEGIQWNIYESGDV